MRKPVLLLLGPAMFFLALEAADGPLGAMTGLLVWMAIWWLTEPVHYAITSLLPLVVMPLTGILPMRETAWQYMDQVIFMFIGGFILAFALEKHGLHRWIALRLLGAFGTGPKAALAAIMLSAFLLSMWISNTTTVMLLVPVATLIATESSDKTARALLLGLAYSATIGGMSTPVGTPTNMIFFGFIAEAYPNLPSPTFLQWMGWGMVVSIGLLCILWLVLWWKYLRKEPAEAASFSIGEPPAIRAEQVVTASIFLTTAMLWLTMRDISFGDTIIRGWVSRMGLHGKVEESTVAIFGALACFLVPSRVTRASWIPILKWDDTQRLPWEVILLFGGGFALSKGMEASGLSHAISDLFVRAAGLPGWLVVSILLLGMMLLSEFASNVASVQLALPVVAALAASLSLEIGPILIITTLGASLGFMMPVATAPNTIVFATRRLEMRDMVLTGLILNIAGVFLLVLRWWFSTN